MRRELTVQCETPMTLRSYLCGSAGISSQMLKRLKAVPDGMTCNGAHIRTVDTVQNGDRLVLHLPETCGLIPNTELSVPVVYESERLLCCDKPVQMPVHPSMLHRNDTLGNWFAAHYPDCGFHLLNRLDRNTSGLCLIAKDAVTAHAVTDVKKRYYALVKPGLHGSGTVDAPIARERESVITRCVRADGRHAVTHYRAVQNAEDCTLLELELETGRTHQIRVHLAYIGYPLLGDALYGGDCSRLQEHALHCGMLSLREPETGERLTLHAPLRADMAAFFSGSVPVLSEEIGKPLAKPV